MHTFIRYRHLKAHNSKFMSLPKNAFKLRQEFFICRVGGSGEGGLGISASSVSFVANELKMLHWKRIDVWGEQNVLRHLTYARTHPHMHGIDKRVSEIATVHQVLNATNKIKLNWLNDKQLANWLSNEKTRWANSMRNWTTKVSTAWIE